MARKRLGIGPVGTGFMGRAHSNAFRQVGRFFASPYRLELAAVCSRNAEKAAEFADNWDYASHETDWRRLIERPDIDIVDIASPNDTPARSAASSTIGRHSCRTAPRRCRPSATRSPPTSSPWPCSPPPPSGAGRVYRLLD